jgi:acyl transferase domain-containing protein/NADPH:quinone reductase-like Zn-dependent oxidoreductase/NAD(P)-dependent dehydrogenase (short-subunit alcohol dehydrogenase family)
MNTGVSLSHLSAVRLALMAEDMRTRAAPVMRADPIAIVGMACRAPGGVESPRAFWDLLAAGKKTTREIPADRFDVSAWHDPDPAAPGKTQTRHGSFLDRVDLFDADYFGIVAREAEEMDPQQRLALEVGIEAIDDAGIPHTALRGSRTAVFMACYHSDYARIAYRDVNALDTRTLTGTVHCVVANRISHFLDLRGPSLTLDTGCSSSLVAVHLACQSLRLGETDLALAGGVSVMITPELFVAMTKVGFMAADGECKTFDASADGFGRGEGCGIVALKRLSDAVGDGDRVLAVIRGSAVNQDGRSTVLTAPNGKAQEALIREALHTGGLSPERITFVETHGTGTALGDPIEVEAIAAVLGRNEVGAAPCYLGSAKANIGHLEAAAGAVGLIKSVEALRHRLIPPQPNFEVLSPHISLDQTRLSIPTSLTSFPASKGSLCAAVSSFGIGGTNGHVIVEEAPTLPRPDPPPDGAIWTLPLSAKSPDGLADLGRAWLATLDDPQGAPIEDLCHTASRRRSHYAVRLAVAGKDASEIRGRLATALNNYRATAGTKEKPRLGFVFSGQGTQWFAMGRELLATETVFRAAMEACDAAIRRTAGWSVIEELTRPEEQSRIDETALAQPALFAVQTALVALWASWGVRPAAVVGHSVGEIAALHASGMLSLDEAVRIVVKRGAIMQAATGLGRMASVALGEADALALVKDYAGQLDVGAVNAPRSTVLSGEPAALEAALDALAARGVSARALHVDYAFHSSQMGALAARFASELGMVRREAAEVGFYSTLAGAAMQADQIDAVYFANAIRNPVRFADAVAAMSADGVNVFVEVGPHPALATAIAETLERKPPLAIVPSLRRARDDRDVMHTALAALYTAGVDPDWAAIQPAEGGVTSLPTYPWQRRQFWIADRHARTPEATGAAWVGTPLPVAGTALTIVPVDAGAIKGWVGDHRVFGEVVVPGAAVVQAMATAAFAVSRGSAPTLKGLLIREPLIIGAESERLQIVATEQAGGWALSLHAQADISARWRVVAEAQATSESDQAILPSFIAGSSFDPQPFYDRLSGSGIEFGPAFRILTRVEIGRDEAQGSAMLPTGISSFEVAHPVLLDAGFQVATIASGIGEGAYLPLGVDRVRLLPSRARTLRLHARVTSRSGTSMAADVFGYDEEGSLVAEIEGVQFVKTDAAHFGGVREEAAETYTIDWRTAPKTADEGLASTWIVLEEQDGTVATTFADALGADGRRVMRVQPDSEGISSILSSLPTEAANAAVACFWPLDAATGTVAENGRLLDLLQVLSAAGPRTVVLVTKGASGADAVCIDERSAMSGAGSAALAAVAALEHPTISLRVVDIGSLNGAACDGRAVLAALRGSQERFLALHGSEVLSRRLRRTSIKAPSRPIQVQQMVDGLDGTEIVPFEPGRPGPGEIRVRVHACGVNFRDTLVGLGAYPGAPAPLGGECAGVVDEVGPGVTGLAVGDRVACLVQGCFATHAIVRAELATPIPDGLRFDTAAAIPIAFLTADIGLNRLAGMRRGDRVLIHAATGGVGLAALTLAQRVGAEVLATAGSPEKRDYLRHRGVAHVFNSRSLDYADQILSATAGEGVRIALNSLTGRFVGETLRTLSPGGVLLELGKREIWTPQQVGAMRPDVRYHIFDAGTMAEAEPELFQQSTRDILSATARGEVPSLPIDVRPLVGVREALRHMAQAQHIGKIVLMPDPAPQLTIRADGSYLVTGGLGGIGLQTAEWLVANGARRLTIAGRSGPSENARAVIEKLELAGASVRVALLDISDRNEMHALLADITRDAPLRGIVHAAGVPANGLVRTLDTTALQEARRGKVVGAQTLRSLTRGMPLDFVVLCSSAAGLFGASGQGAYVAANAELETLAVQWRREGAPVVCIAWGPWAESGMFATSSAQVREGWRARGLTPMSNRRSVAALEQALATWNANVVAAAVNWPKVFANEQADRSNSLFADFVPQAQTPSVPAPASGSNLVHLRSLPAGLQRSALMDMLAKQARTVLDLPGDAPVPPSVPLEQVGLDSLMAVELRNQFARLGGVPLPATLCFDHPTLDALADRLAEVWKLRPLLVTDWHEASEDNDIEAISDAEAESMLEAELASLSADSAHGRRAG